MTAHEQPPERRESLWMLTTSPVIWSAHFLLSYITAAVWCAKIGRDGALTGPRIAIAIYTLVALAGIAVITWLGFRRHTIGTTTAAHDFDSPAGRHGFLGFAVVLLSILSAIATIYVALAAVFIGTCR
jgi:hypothetical protein